jgi:hypothetical protein
MQNLKINGRFAAPVSAPRRKLVHNNTALKGQSHEKVHGIIVLITY